MEETRGRAWALMFARYSESFRVAAVLHEEAMRAARRGNGLIDAASVVFMAAYVRRRRRADIQWKAYERLRG